MFLSFGDPQPFKFDHPVVLAPMGFAGGGKLAAAVVSHADPVGNTATASCANDAA